MHHIFITQNQLSEDGKTLRITGDDFHHIARVLRMREGEELSASMEGAEYRFRIEGVTKDEVICALCAAKEVSREAGADILLLQCLPKGDKMEQVIQKAVELGASGVLPVNAKRCVVRLDAARAKTKLMRWQKIAEAAAMQSKRSVMPKVHEVMTLADALHAVSDADVKLIAYERAGQEDGPAADMTQTRRLLDGVGRGQRVALLIGPEGGFEEAEVARAEQTGFCAVTLGRRILRTETAGMALLSYLMLRLEE